MRHRATLLLLLAGLFALSPFLQWRAQENACIAAIGGGSVPLQDPIGIPGVDIPSCPYSVSPSPMNRGLSILSGLCLCGFLVLLVQGVAERRHEQALLDRAGIHIPEGELPIEQ